MAFTLEFEFNTNQTIFHTNTTVLFDVGGALDELESITCVEVAVFNEAGQLEFFFGVDNKGDVFCCVLAVNLLS